MLSKLCDIRRTHSLQSQSFPQPGIHIFPAYQPPCLASKSLTSQIDSIIESLAFLSSVLNLLLLTQAWCGTKHPFRGSI